VLATHPPRTLGITVTRGTAALELALVMSQATRANDAARLRELRAARTAREAGGAGPIS